MIHQERIQCTDLDLTASSTSLVIERSRKLFFGRFDEPQRLVDLIQRQQCIQFDLAQGEEFRGRDRLVRRGAIR